MIIDNINNYEELESYLINMKSYISKEQGKKRKK